MLPTIFLSFLISFYAFQATNFIVAGEENTELKRVIRHSREVHQFLREMRVMDKSETYLEVHLLMVEAINRETGPLLLEMKQRSKRRDMRTIRQSGRCLSTARQKIGELSQQVYLNQIGDCSKLFIDKYAEISHRIVQLYHESAVSASQLYRMTGECMEKDNKDACINNGTRVMSERFEVLDNSAKSLKIELKHAIRNILKEIVTCFNGVSPLLNSTLSVYKEEFYHCIGK